MPRVRLEDVTVVYLSRDQIQLFRDSGGQKALDGVDLEIQNGETISIVGPSGCGKSTLIRVIAGLVPVDDGTVYYDDDDVTSLPTKDRGVGIVFQDYALYPSFKGKGNLSFFFWLRRRSRDETNERVKVTADILGVGFDQLLGRMPSTLSGGQKQRVAIGRCIVRDPNVFLLDEPLSNLDAKLRVKTRSEIKRLLSRFGITTIYVTHDQTEAVAMGDRIVIMDRGQVKQVGTFDELYSRPADTFVAGFLGSPPMNLFPGSVIGKGQVVSEGFTLHVPAADAQRASPGSKVTVGIRPDNMSLAAEPGPNRMGGEVILAEPLVSEQAQLVHVRCGSLKYVAKIASVPKLGIGDVVAMNCPQDALYIFDSDGHALARGPESLRKVD